MMSLNRSYAKEAFAKPIDEPCINIYRMLMLPSFYYSACFTIDGDAKTIQFDMLNPERFIDPTLIVTNPDEYAQKLAELEAQFPDEKDWHIQLTQVVADEDIDQFRTFMEKLPTPPAHYRTNTFDGLSYHGLYCDYSGQIHRFSASNPEGFTSAFRYSFKIFQIAQKYIIDEANETIFKGLSQYFTYESERVKNVDDNTQYISLTFLNDSSIEQLEIYIRSLPDNMRILLDVTRTLRFEIDIPSSFIHFLASRQGKSVWQVANYEQDKQQGLSVYGIDNLIHNLLIAGIPEPNIVDNYETALAMLDELLAESISIHLRQNRLNKRDTCSP